jgi:hypothetical protein
MKRLFDGVLDQVNAGQFTPAWGDSGAVYGGLVGADAEMFQTAYRYYKDPRYAALLARLGATGDASFKSFESLFREPVAAAAAAGATPEPAPPRLLDGTGLAVLTNPADDVSLTLEYGLKHGHGHYDRLNFELFANAQPMMPDLGYPDAMNDFVSSIYTWSKNTIAHNTVVVDAKRQVDNVPGVVQAFADSSWARVVDVEANGTYPQCSTYRRAIIQVDVAPGQSYFVDVFTVAGGKQLDYSLHGPPGAFESRGARWSDPRRGTLAGEEVPLGQIYDDKTLGAPGYKGGYSGYAGSGFQHLYNVRTLTEGNGLWFGEWKHARDEHAMLRVHLIDQPGQQVFLCDARVSPAKHPEPIKYLIARRTALGGDGDGGELASRFISVLEPFRDKSIIKRVNHTNFEQGDGVGLLVTLEDGTVDFIVYGPAAGEKRLGSINTSALVAIDRRSASGAVQRFRVYAAPPSGDVARTFDRSHTGRVVDVLPLRSAVAVTLDSRPGFDERSLIGRVVHFVNDRHRTAHTIRTVERDGDRVILSLADDLLVGVAKLDAVDDAHTLSTSTALPLAAAYRGTTLSDDLFRTALPVKSVAGGKIALAGDGVAPGSGIKPGDTVWFLDAGPGDRVEIPFVLTDERFPMPPELEKP